MLWVATGEINLLIVLKNGKIKESGNTADIISDPKVDYTKLLMNSCQSDWINK